MKIPHRWITLVALLLAALISYGVGFSQSLVLLIVLGLVLEFTFWFGVFNRK